MVDYITAHKTVSDLIRTIRITEVTVYCFSFSFVADLLESLRRLP